MGGEPMNSLILFVTLGIKDWIEIGGLLVGIIVSSVAVYVSMQSNKISRQTLLENNRMIEESTRPNLVIYPYIYYPGTMLYGLVIKNAGPTSCVIDQFQIDDKHFEDCVINTDSAPLEQTLINMTLGPNQSKIIHINQPDSLKAPVTFSFKYSSSTREYSDSSTIDFNAGTAIATKVNATKDKELHRIYLVLLEILKKDI